MLEPLSQEVAKQAVAWRLVSAETIDTIYSQSGLLSWM
jgi:hypothetical protein